MYLTDVVARAHQLGKGVGSFVLQDSVQAEGVNDLVQLASLRARENRRIMEWMRAGAAIIDPATTHIDVDVTPGNLTPSSSLAPFFVARRTVAAFAVVGPNSELDSVTVGERCRSTMKFAAGVEIAPGEVVSPFSMLVTER